MQYIDTSTSSQMLIFTKPCSYDSSPTLVFTSYTGNFSVSCQAEELNNFVRCSFTLTDAQLALFDTGTEFHVQFGTARDIVGGTITSTTVIEYGQS